MKRIILAGPDSVALATVMHSIQHVVKDKIVFTLIETNKHLEEVKNNAFQAEPLVLTCHKHDFFVPKYNDIPRNKFFDRPRNNFRKR